MYSAPILLLLLPIIASTGALNIPLSPQKLTASHPLQLQSHNSSLAAANPSLTYRIPETQTVLYINYFPFFQIPREDLVTAINSIRTRMATHIKDKGDGWLLAKDDPIVETISDVESNEWDVIIHSSPVTVHMTYGVVLDVMEGWEHLINGQVGPCQIFAAIQNTKRGQVGRLRVVRSRGGTGTGDLLID